ncbi:energy transducer TonB [Chromobacterium phragmitis]|uniref:Energy transducer TonB n=1 Tax=Chromobacterium phragmitis TaxID=2202141 RepID=A0ABV0IT98_9NEIS
MRTSMMAAGLLAMAAAMAAEAAGCERQQAPDYPLAALRDGVAGVVTVTFKVSADGKVAEIGGAAFSASIPPQYRSGFRAEIAKALREYRCVPGAALSQAFEFRPEEE